METNSSVDVAGFEQIMLDQSGLCDGLKTDEDGPQPKRKRHNNDSTTSVALDEDHFDQFLTPSICRLVIKNKHF